jgi:hypothetical protein
MLILFDNGTPRGLARFLAGHTVVEARSRGWEELANGAMIAAAEQAGFHLLVTTDKNIQYQQNLTFRKLSVIVLEHSQWPMVEVVAEKIVSAVDAATNRSRQPFWRLSRHKAASLVFDALRVAASLCLAQHRCVCLAQFP